MTDNKQESLSKQDSGLVDLNELKNLSFGPDWSSKQSSFTSTKEHKKSPKRTIDSNRPDKSRDRRPNQTRFTRKPQQDGYRQPFVDYEVSFYPEDTPFKALTKAIRNSCKTYQLFEIANLILEKEDRFLASIKKKDPKNPDLFLVLADKIPFNTEEEALAHVLTNNLEAYFNMEEIEVEAPSGNFPMVNRCSITGKLLGPPNYHRYQQLLQNHHSTHLNNISFEDFQKKIVSDKTPEAIEEWLQSMKKQTRYAWKDNKGDDTLVFDNIESVRSFLVSQKKDLIIKKVDCARCSGKNISKLPQGHMRNKVLNELERQRKFPLDTANNLRGRLRRLNLNIYKKGSEGIAYVSAVKRNFRKPGTVFSDSIQKLIRFIEESSDLNVKDLCEKYLGFQHSRNAEENQSHESTINEDQKALFSQLMLDLRWLVSEGYVIEYGDGQLLAVPPMPTAKPNKDSEELQNATTQDSPHQEVTSNEEETKNEVAPLPSENS